MLRQEAIQISAFEFRRNFGRYLKEVEHQDFVVKKKGKIVAELRNPNKDRLALAESLMGSVPGKTDLEADKKERIESI